MQYLIRMGDEFFGHFSSRIQASQILVELGWKKAEGAPDPLYIKENYGKKPQFAAIMTSIDVQGFSRIKIKELPREQRKKRRKR